MNPLKWLSKRIKEMGAYKESDTKRDGAFSFAGETHAFAYGIYYGFIDFMDWDGMPENYGEGHVVEKGHYGKFGYILGAVIRVLCYLLVGSALL